MNWKSALKLRIANIVSTFVVAFIVFIATSLSKINIGGPSYFNFPFKIKQLSCGTALGSTQSCTYHWILSGIIYSIIFWILIYIIASVIFYRKKK